MILKANMKDAEAISRIATSAFVDSHAQSAPRHEIERYIREKYDKKHLAGELENPANLYYLIKHNSVIAGFSKLMLDKPYPTGPETSLCKLEQLYFSKGFTGLGLGSVLLQYNIFISQKCQQTGMWLEVWSGNDGAIAFYEKAGFEIIDNGKFALTPTHSNPHYVMYRRY